MRPSEEFYREGQSRHMLRQRVCVYLRGGEECSDCPDVTTSQGETASPMCRLMAEELIAVVAEALARGEEHIAQDNEPRP